MISLNCSTMATFTVPRKPPARTACLAFNIHADDLRAQLDQLHLEAQNTRAKASNARLRLMRLSEAAEKLQHQAAISVQSGRETDARELLLQKKRVMQALEKSKSRIALLDELSAKLNEAISVKETQLIERVSSDLKVGGNVASGPVRIVSPKQEEDLGNLHGNNSLDSDALRLGEDQTLQVHSRSQADRHFIDVDYSESSSVEDIWNEADFFCCLKGISSYEDFLELLNQQLKTIEEELVTVLRLSTLLFDGEEKPESLKAKLLLELLEGVRDIRARIENITQLGGNNCLEE